MLDATRGVLVALIPFHRGADGERLEAGDVLLSTAALGHSRLVSVDAYKFVRQQPWEARTAQRAQGPWTNETVKKQFTVYAAEKRKSVRL